MIPDSITYYSSSFADLQAEFYQYLRMHTSLNKKTCSDYISRLKFLANQYSLDKSLTKERIEEIMRKENSVKAFRHKYNNSHAMSDFHSGLMKFLEFINSPFLGIKDREEQEEILKIESTSSLTKTEKETIVNSRIGQGLFRQRLFEYWHSCAITGCDIPWFLMASHIKPWRSSDNQERLDRYNGLLLTPNYDKLFDKGYISFSSEGQIIVSPLLTRTDKMSLHIDEGVHLRRIAPMHEKYLQYHREHCLLD